MTKPSLDFAKILLFYRIVRIGHCFIVFNTFATLLPGNITLDYFLPPFGDTFSVSQ
jgi:hypothetical protein